MKSNLILLVTAVLLLPTQYILAQSENINDLDQDLINWYNKDFASDATMGVSVERVYQKLLVDISKKRKKVIVAVIDSGVDIDHEDLQGKIWINKDEIPGNGIDDDGNGYVDDIHGWNFLGNAKGENIANENVEYTRIIRDNTASKELLQSALLKYEKELESRQEEMNNLRGFQQYYLTIKSFVYSKTGVEVNKLEDIREIKSTDAKVWEAVNFLKDRYEKGFTEEDLDEYIAHVNDYLEFHLNKDFTPRTIVGDNPYDLSDIGYGNPDVKGPDSRHGTGVASVIAANRGEGIGIDGIADLVEIMVIRSTPNGDERDKDVALAIMYAVDNGARIINMSFGKDFSPQKEFVDQAVKYAEEKGVLLVHAAGNDGANIDIVGNFPSATYSNNIKASNWIEVGANAKFADKELATSFSNYGGNNVDIFAPGHDIIAADTSNTYSTNSGTSLAAPVVTGVAALLMSAYPDLSPQEIKDILMVSSHQPKKPRKVYLPGDNEKKQKVKFKELSQSGGIINAYEAMVEAERRQRVTEQSK